MAKVDPFSILYSKRVSALDFRWDTMVAPPLLSLISAQDIYTLNQIATSNKLSSDPDEKYRRIANILIPRGFKKIASGTNRVAYKYLNNQNLCLKVAFDKVGLKDNPAEFQNQFKLKPFVTRLFEVSPCGTVALVERVEPLVNIEEFEHIVDDVFNLIVEKIIGKYVVDDIGTEYWQNIGIRSGFGPVLLDFPYVYELDGAKIHCNWLNPITHEYCLGEIDYDDGFNHLICSKCGKSYQARQLGKQIERKNIVIEKKGETKAMSIKIMRGNQVVREFKTESESKTITPPPEETIARAKVLNKKKFDKRQQEKQKIERNNKKAVEDAMERYDKKIQNQINDGLSKLQEPDDSNGILTDEPEIRIINAAQKAKELDPNYITNSRFARSVQLQNKNEIPENHMRDQLSDYAAIREDTSGIKLKNFHEEKIDYTSVGEKLSILADPSEYEYTIKNDTDIAGYINPDNIPKKDAKEIVEVPADMGSNDYNNLGNNETSSTDNEELVSNSSWDNPVNVSKITIDIGNDDVSDMY